MAFPAFYVMAARNTAVTADANVPVTGVFATGEVGTVTVFAGIEVFVTGVQATGAVGSAAITADANINVDMIIQVVSDDTTATDITFTVPTADFDRAKTILEGIHDQIGYASLQGATDVVKVSAIGVGMRSHAGVAAKAFKALADKGINIRAITTSEIKFSVLIDQAYTELAVRTLHSLYGLDKP